MIKMYDYSTGKPLGHYQTQKEAAQAAGATQGSVSQILNGKSKKTISGFTFKLAPVDWVARKPSSMSIKELGALLIDLQRDIDWFRDEGEYCSSIYDELKMVYVYVKQELEARKNEINKLI